MRVVILGGGYSSIWCYRALRRWMGASADITVVAPFSDHVFHGWTAEVLDGDLDPSLQASPLTECVPKAERVRGWATRVDPQRREVEVEWRGERTVVAYDQLVVATGAQDRTAPVPGMAEHGWPLRFPGQVEELLGHLAGLEAGPAADAVEQRRRSTIVVVGAGFAGTEAAAALGRRYGDSRRVVLVSSTSAVVPLWQDQARLQERLLRNLADAGVEVLTDTRVAEVDPRGVRFGDGSRIEAATIVSAIGNSVSVLPGLERFQDPEGLLAVDDCLRVTDGVWSAGDVAAVRSRGARAPKEALWAIRAGTTVGRNIARTARRAAPRRFGFRGLGTVAAFAPGRSVATIWGVQLPEAVGWLVRGAFFLWYVPSRRTAAKIVRAGLRPSTRALRADTAPIRVVRPALVGLEGGVTSADRLRAVGASEPVRRGA